MAKTVFFQYVSTHSRLKAAGTRRQRQREGIEVSTHSRLKAAGLWPHNTAVSGLSFNTQPPEGGWTY